MRFSRCLAIALAAVSLAACQGGAPDGPTAPSSGAPGAPAATAGATINGQVSSANAATATPTSGGASARATPIATVTVVGTSLSTGIDGAGRFMLAGVPAGSVQLRFMGPGTDATVSVGSVSVGDTIELTFAVHGGQATVLGDSRNPNAAHVPINGDIVSLTGTPDSFEFRIGGQLIRGDTLTEFFGHPGQNRADIFAVMNGTRAEVKAWPRTGFFYAERLHVNLGGTLPTPPTGSEPPQDSSASIEGILTSMTGSIPTLQLVVAGVTVRTSASTEVQRRGDRQDLAALRTGMTIHVVGDRQPDGSINARRLQIKDDASGGVFEIEGSLGGLKGSCPAITFGVNGYSIVANASTTFSPACAELKSGNKVRVVGVRQASGDVLATSVTRN
jgi:hypothetical protein